MGVMSAYGREHRPVRVVTYSLACDAWGCGAWLRLTVADDPGFGQEPGTILHVEGGPIPWEDDGDGEAISCVDDAIRYATGKRCRQVSYRLGCALRNARRWRKDGLDMDDRRRLDSMLAGLSTVLKICLDHPDWKIRTES